MTSIPGCLPFISNSRKFQLECNGKWFLGSSHWKIPGTNGNSEKVVPFYRMGRSEWKFVYHLQVSWVSNQFHVVTRIQSSAVQQYGNFRQMVNDTYHSYRPKIPNQNFRSFFINGKQPVSLLYGNHPPPLQGYITPLREPLSYVFCL